MTAGAPASPARRDALALSLMAGVGPTAYGRRVRAAGGRSEALAQFPAKAIAQSRRRAERYLERARGIGATCALPEDEPFPQKLRVLDSVPPIVWLRGMPALAEQRSVAIVGTRGASTAGVRFARQLAAACAEADVCVVSGLARGIDAAAHQGALEAGGSTVAVLGTGVDVPYPTRHHALQEQIARDGLLVSEVPPGERGHAGTFPQRNRLIAALSELTVVVEAGRQSGALITARVCTELGRTVCAVPGTVYAGECAGSNALLQEGATMLLSPDDLLSELGITSDAATTPRLEGDAATCWDVLQAGTADVETLAVRAKLPLRRVIAAISALEVHGLIALNDGGQVQSLVPSP